MSSLTYEYAPLREDNDEIRVITILPAKANAEMRLLISECRLRSDFHRQYEALSYAWGPTDNLVHIFVGSTGNTILPVTQNLAVALHHLRYDQEPRIFWIDAISINQSNLHERSLQVLKMGDIYANAAKVVVWLGPSADNSPLAFDIFNAVKLSSYEDSKLPVDMRTIRALAKLLSRPWFERLWVWQEIHLAKPNAILICGTNTVTWKSFCDCICQISKMATKAAPLDLTLDLPLKAALVLCSTRKNDALKALVYRTRNAKCADSRDRVYALLSLLKESERRLIRPDYSLPSREVYQTLFLRFALERKTLDLLIDCNLRTEECGHPTWVPDWSRPNQYCRILNANASGQSVCDAQYIENMILRVTGVKFGIIRTAKKASLSCGRSVKGVLEEMGKLAPSDDCPPDKGYPGGTYTMLEAFCRTVCSNEFWESYTNNDARLPGFYEFTQYPSISQWAEALSRGFQFLHEKHLYLNHIINMLNSRSLFITEDNYIGIGPGNLRPGDEVCILLGCPSPMILRPIGEAQYKVVGESYVQGLMNSEGLLGPLPSQYRAAQKNHQTSRYYWVYKESIEGAGTVKCYYHYEDPRLEALPAGWQRKRNKPGNSDSFFCYQEKGGGEAFGDPRLLPTALRARGIALRSFDLF
ncbi:hypothetical protein BP6252_05921 [Coleophoma cylindrospora]|uniref:Heterokaryon incompatibility domain-containing protein n=1 Tax=Coleophoma cylindrospora TaxID=1849047 RepID=A0A3D8RL71_9HELO|nr:hypothetical protein BP6252_05921 [Coleophoma cylindrospora]